MTTPHTTSSKLTPLFQAIRRQGLYEQETPAYYGHTPGPWSIGQYRNGHDEAWRNKPSYDVAVYDSDSVKVALVEQWVGEKWERESEANACLVAAAPDLLRERDQLRAQLAAERANVAELVAALNRARLDLGNIGANEIGTALARAQEVQP